MTSQESKTSSTTEKSIANDSLGELVQKRDKNVFSVMCNLAAKKQKVKACLLHVRIRSGHPETHTDNRICISLLDFYWCNVLTKFLITSRAGNTHGIADFQLSNTYKHKCTDQIKDFWVGWELFPSSIKISLVKITQSPLIKANAEIWVWRGVLQEFINQLNWYGEQLIFYRLYFVNGTTKMIQLLELETTC